MSSLQQSAWSILAILTLTVAHSWVEQMSNVDSNGRYLSGHGYPRTFVDKGVPHFNQSADLWLVPPLGRQPAFISQSDLLCHPSQRNFGQSHDYPRLQSMPGGMIAMRYAENGHVTIPGGGANLWGKPERGGTVFVFGTSQPHTEEILLDVLRWTRDGLGGDQRGQLLAAQNFDDGRCYQLGNGAALANLRKQETPNTISGQPGADVELLCETDVRLPVDIPLGKPYTLYWVWQWPTAPGKDPNQTIGRDEYYISCAEVDVVSSASSLQTDNPLIQQDPMPLAVENFASRSALTTDPLGLYSDPAFHTPLPADSIRCCHENCSACPTHVQK